uniref:Tc1-like transposase DDE domain-containing protein n=1 Tax=Cyprinus carpio carpio TaxID=630221 RepID=A0A9J7YM24_CYPCA
QLSKRRPLTPCTRRARHKRSLQKKAGCSQSSVSKHINREGEGRKRCGRKKCTSNRDNCTLERIVKQNPFKNVGEIHKEWTAAGVSASRTTTQSVSLQTGSQSLEEERRGTQSTLLEVQCKVSTVSDGLGCHVICWCWSTVFSEVQGPVYQEVLEHFMLPAADQLYGDADFIFQQDLAPAHSAKASSTWFKDHGIPVLNWPANSPDLNPIENL